MGQNMRTFSKKLMYLHSKVQLAVVGPGGGFGGQNPYLGQTPSFTISMASYWLSNYYSGTSAKLVQGHAFYLILKYFQKNHGIYNADVSKLNYKSHSRTRSPKRRS